MVNELEYTDTNDISAVDYSPLYGLRYDVESSDTGFVDITILNSDLDALVLERSSNGGTFNAQVYFISLNLSTHGSTLNYDIKECHSLTECDKQSIDKTLVWDWREDLSGTGDTILDGGIWLVCSILIFFSCLVYINIEF